MVDDGWVLMLDVWVVNGGRVSGGDWRVAVGSWRVGWCRPQGWVTGGFSGGGGCGPPSNFSFASPSPDLVHPKILLHDAPDPQDFDQSQNN